jgi:hypothetical protein
MMAMDLREAMSQIAEIRRQMARTELFRGYRSVPVAFSGLLAWVAAIAQSIWIADPIREFSQYLTLWLAAAAIGITAAGVEMALRARHDPRWAREHIWVAVEQFLPCLLAGGLTTLVIARSSEPIAWLLPGLWSIFFSLGVFASRRLLPKATILVAFYYLLAGLATLALARGEAALSPWAMGLSFGGGQLLAALVLYRTLERDHGIE